MNKKINVALIYRECPSLSPNYFFTNLYNFFFKALKRNDQIDVTYFSGGKSFDATKLKGKFDVIVLPDNQNKTGDAAIPDQIIGLDKIDIPVICKPGDFHDALQFDPNFYHEKLKITAYFDMEHPDYFHKYYPKNFKFKTVFIGLEPSLFTTLTPFDKRIKNKILNSGNVGNSKLLSRLITKLRKKGKNTNFDFYKLRTLCNLLPYVKYTSTLQHEFIGDKYPQLLQKYCASIAASTTTPTRKYLEIPAAGCLTFMEVTEKNRGKYLQFKDDDNVIFINEKNYKKKFCEYLDDSENKKWEEIAKRGQYHAKNNLSNDKGVELLVDLIKEII
jgi:hypothetical protein